MLPSLPFFLCLFRKFCPKLYNLPIPTGALELSYLSIRVGTMDKVLIVTATKVEAEEVLAQFCQASGAEGESCFIGRKTYCVLGEVGGVDLFMVQSEMGSGTPGGSSITVSKAINDISPIAVILVARSGDVLQTRFRGNAPCVRQCDVTR